MTILYFTDAFYGYHVAKRMKVIMPFLIKQNYFTARLKFFAVK